MCFYFVIIFIFIFIFHVSFYGIFSRTFKLFFLGPKANLTNSFQPKSRPISVQIQVHLSGPKGRQGWLTNEPWNLVAQLQFSTGRLAFSFCPSRMAPSTGSHVRPSQGLPERTSLHAAIGRDSRSSIFAQAHLYIAYFDLPMAVPSK